MKKLISPKSQLDRGRTSLWPQGVCHQRAYQSVPSSFMLRKEGEMRVRAIRTFSSHILSKNKTVLLGQTALRLWLYNLIRLSSLLKKMHQNSYLKMSKTHYTCCCPLISKVTSRVGIIGLYQVFIASLWLSQTVRYLTLTMVAKLIS